MVPVSNPEEEIAWLQKELAEANKKIEFLEEDVDVLEHRWDAHKGEVDDWKKELMNVRALAENYATCIKGIQLLVAGATRVVGEK